MVRFQAVHHGNDSCVPGEHRSQTTEQPGGRKMQVNNVVLLLPQQTHEFSKMRQVPDHAVLPQGAHGNDRIRVNRDTGPIQALGIERPGWQQKMHGMTAPLKVAGEISVPRDTGRSFGDQNFHK